MSMIMTSMMYENKDKALRNNDDAKYSTIFLIGSSVVVQWEDC